MLVLSCTQNACYGLNVSSRSSCAESPLGGVESVDLIQLWCLEVGPWDVRFDKIIRLEPSDSILVAS